MSKIATYLATCVSLVSASVAHASSGIEAVCGQCQAQKVATCGGFLEGPTNDQVGSLWLADVGKGRILQVERGECHERVKTNGHPNGAQFTHDGKLIIADWSGLLSYDPKSGRLAPLATLFQGKAVTGLNDLTLDASGGIYFTVPGESTAVQKSGRVFYRSADGVVALIDDTFAYPNGIALSADGTAVLIAEFAAKRIISIPAVGSKKPFQMPYVFALTSGGVGPDGMRVDERGRLFVANLGAGEVQVYDAQARLIGAIGLPADAGQSVTNVAIHKGSLYITEADKGEVWKVDLIQ